MKKTYALILTLLIGFSFGFIASKDPFDVGDILTTQKLFGLSFNKTEADTMFRYLKDNLKGYEEMRKISVDNEIPPAFTFHTNYHPDPKAKPHLPIKWKPEENVSLPDSSYKLAYYSITQLASLIKAKKITSVQLTKLYLERIKNYDDTLKSVISLTEDRALSQAKKADEEISKGKYRGLLHGIPYGLKDLFTVKGTRTTWGAGPYKDQSFDYDATIVEKLDKAGAVLVAKLVSGELARGDVWFGGKTKNPWDLKQGASGSSAGPGAAVSAGLVAFAIGTETLGSIIAPSSRCGVTGLRPTYGRVSRYGGMTLSWSMDKVGPIARNAKDCAIVLEALMGVDGKDESVVNAPYADFQKTDAKTLRIMFEKAILKNDTTFYGKHLNAFIKELNTKGVTITQASLPKKDLPFKAFDIILRCEAGAFFDELVRNDRDSLLTEKNRGSRANSLRQSRFVPAVEYIQANRYRKVLMNKMDSLFNHTDILIVPATGTEQSMITNLTGHPALALPIGIDDKGRPMSMILIGNLYQEDKIVAFAQWIQSFTDYHLKRPKYFKQ